MMKTEFVLRFNIGNETTLGDANVADILRKIADDIAFKGIEDNRHLNVRDGYGHPVGRYGRYTSEEES
jgi:hypothetical protein